LSIRLSPLLSRNAFFARAACRLSPTVSCINAYCAKALYRTFVHQMLQEKAHAAAGALRTRKMECRQTVTVGRR